MMTLDELCSAACSYQTKTADALLVACVKRAIETKHRLDLRQEDVERFVALITEQPE